MTLESIDGFRSRGEFERFERWLAELVEEGQLERVPLRSRYAGLHTARERWYRQAAEGHTWRLVDPDPPFDGVFEPVGESPD